MHKYQPGYNPSKGNLKTKIFVADSFLITYSLIILSISANGMGSFIFGTFVYTNVSTLFIYLTLLFQLFTRTLRFPVLLIPVFIYIFLQTFILNFTTITFSVSVKQYIGIVLFSISLFSFVTVYKDRLIDIIRIYYKFTFFISLIACLQISIFLFFGKSLVPQNFLSGTTKALQSNTFTPEILNIFPRAVGLSAEPSHFAILVIPGVYIALLVLSGKGIEFGVTSKTQAIIILLGLLLSFSLMGYLGLVLCLLFIFSNQLKRNLVKKILISIPFIAILYFSFHSPIGSRVTSLISMLKDVKNYEYTSSTLSGWALVSNMVVANEGLKNSYFLGTGVCTHQNNYDDNIHKLFRNEQIIMELNKEDGGSLFIRLTSEFGLPGIIFYILFLIYFRIGRGNQASPIKTINTICFVLLITYSLRNGAYISNVFILFLAIYYTSFVRRLKNVEKETMLDS